MFPLYLKRTTDDAPPEEPIAYIVGKNGTFVQKQTPVFRAVIAAKGLPMLETVQEEAEYLLPALPAHLVAQILIFFRAIYDRQQTEVVLLIAYNQERNEFALVVPEQTVTSAHCSYVMPPSAPSGFVFVGTIHSHASMSAFHSGTDQHDEQFFDGIHLTVGRLDRSRFEIVATMAISGKRFPQLVPRVLGGIRFEKDDPPPVVVTKDDPLPVVVTPHPCESADAEDHRSDEVGASRVMGGSFLDIVKTSLDDIIDRYSFRKRRKRRYEPPRYPGQKSRFDRLGSIAPTSPPFYRSLTPPNDGYVLDLPPETSWQDFLPPAEWGAIVSQPVTFVPSLIDYTSKNGGTIGFRYTPKSHGYYGDGEDEPYGGG